ncbi:unnamed protein product [Nyctereutes procyonoides]|uniref:(raccoon dog) hypothetical protein n=1 Tax=Nyctereutes procyonoides TaxID=34880 RepID=A0A811YFB8_NYCPR|nr:unnamed protein product [Nyctereutes procyonoides]
MSPIPECGSISKFWKNPWPAFLILIFGFPHCPFLLFFLRFGFLL